MCFKQIKLANPDSRFPMKHFTSKHTKTQDYILFPGGKKSSFSSNAQMKDFSAVMWHPSWKMKHMGSLSGTALALKKVDWSLAH